MTAPAFWRRLRARLGGYFWSPCPCCGRMTAGYEWKRGGVPNGRQVGSNKNTFICPPCYRRGYSRDDVIYLTGVPISQRLDLPRRWRP